jgi:hypothetical protein
MNRANENQHWISRHLLKRFKIEGAPFQCYQVETGEWIPKGIERTCASPGYNQLLAGDEADNTLEEAFSKVESGLKDTLSALEEAVNKPRSELPQAFYENLCWYCSFLKGISPIAKPGAVVAFIFQLNMEIEGGGGSLLRDLSLPEEVISRFRNECAAGRKVIVESKNLLQLLYRFQFRRQYGFRYTDFLWTKWIVSKSPIELPMSDVGLIPMFLESEKANHYILPIGPHLLLEGISFHDQSKNSSEPVIRGLSLTREEAEYRFDCICASAITEIICARKLSDIQEALNRAKVNGIKFYKIPNSKGIASAGMEDAGSGDFRFRVVSVDEYKKVMHSHMLP